MKKVALSLLALALVGAAAFADAPKWDPKVTTALSGNATLTVGYDLDTGAANLANASSATLVIDLISSGDVSSSSDKDIWGEIKVTTDGDPQQLKGDGSGSPAVAATNSLKVKVDHAQINFGKNAYLSITSYGTDQKYAYAPDMAYDAKKVSGLYGATVADVYSALGSKGPTGVAGFEAGFKLPDIASVTLDLADDTAWVGAGPNTAKGNLSYKIAASLLAVPNLTLKGGYSASTKDKSDKVVGGQVAYQLSLGDKPFVKPQAGVTLIQVAGTGDFLPQYNAGVLYALDAKAATFDNYGLKLDQDWGGYPGVSFGIQSTDKKIAGTTKDTLWIGAGANSGALIADTGVVAAFGIKDLNGKDNNGNGIDTVVTAGATNTFKTGDVSFASKATVNFESDATAATAVSHLYFKFTSDITGVIPFVTFTVNYASNDLSDKGNTVAGNTKGKFEFTTKISL